MYVKTIRPNAKRDESVPVTPKRAEQIFEKANCFNVIFYNSELCC